MAPANASSLQLWILLTRAVKTVEDRLRRQLEAYEINLSEFNVLEVLYHQDAISIGEIGQKVVLTSGTMTYVIDKLERRGLLKRRPSEQDRRVTLAEFTPSGRELAARLFPERAVLLGELFAGLSRTEQEEAGVLLKRLLRHMDHTIE